MDSRPPGSSVHGILQAIILEWVAISFSGGSSQPGDRTWVSWISRQILYHWATREAPEGLRGCPAKVPNLWVTRIIYAYLSSSVKPSMLHFDKKSSVETREGEISSEAKTVTHVSLLEWALQTIGRGNSSLSAGLGQSSTRIARRDKKAFLNDQCKEIEENNRMGNTRDLFRKIRYTKWTFHEKMGSIKDRNGMDLTKAEDIKKRWQEYTEELYKKDLHNPDNHNGVITHLEPDILECEAKWALGSITTNKASGGDGIPVELFQILKDDAVKVLHSICKQIWKTQQWP